MNGIKLTRCTTHWPNLPRVFVSALKKRLETAPMEGKTFMFLTVILRDVAHISKQHVAEARRDVTNLFRISIILRRPRIIVGSYKKARNCTNGREDIHILAPNSQVCCSLNRTRCSCAEEGCAFFVLHLISIPPPADYRWVAQKGSMLDRWKRMMCMFFPFIIREAAQM